MFRWFVGLGVDAPTWDHSTFSKNRDRLLDCDIADQFLSVILTQTLVRRLSSAGHFSVDGTLVEAWASMKSLEASDNPDPPGGDERRKVLVDFRGEKRSNATHASITDPDAMLYRKVPGMKVSLITVWRRTARAACRCSAGARLRPCRAIGGAGDDRGACRGTARRHTWCHRG
jgi:hypothetical protein